MDEVLACELVQVSPGSVPLGVRRTTADLHWGERKPGRVLDPMRNPILLLLQTLENQAESWQPPHLRKQSSGLAERDRVK